MTIHSYIENIAKDYVRGIATEHTFRPALKTLIEELIPEIAATNEPKRIECGAPDYVITRKDIPVGYIEAKDIGVDLDGKNLKEQFDRYRDALDNLVFTDYLDFRFYLNGEQTTRVKIAEIQNGRIVPLPENFEQFASLIKEFCSRSPQTIKSSKKLAEMMAEKAKILAYIIKNALDEDIAAGAVTDLTNQMKAFKDILIHDIDAKAFADIYAQTIAYGMFAARLHDDSLDTFSRQEAAEKIPKTNPFLRKLFQFIAAFDLDTRIDWIVDALADLFRATDIAAILKNFGKSTQTHDPIMHFYETFLAEYDPKLRKSRGVFYTPEPVVDFIVRAVDDILKTEFNLPNGLADTSKTKIKVDVQGKLQEQEVHRVQILDPATGTGTFLATVIKHIYKGFENQQGVWNQYVDEHLVPRLNGFELLMASYAMAHLKLDLLLTELSMQKPAREQGLNAQVEGKALANARASATQRLQIYLTNALEEYHPDTGTLFASWLSTEANEANHIKRDTPVMVVIGNPPYSGESANKGEWIMSLMDDYKKEPGGVEKLKERNPKWINDDYVKFLRYGQYFIEKNGEGILAFINPHGFLDNPTFRGMRWNLLKTYDKIYVLDLHGNSNKKETSPDGSLDVNVFDIQQGVSVNILIKTGKKKSNELGRVFHSEAFGTRETKYNFLTDNSLITSNYKEVPLRGPMYFFVEKDLEIETLYNKGFSLSELMRVNVLGFQTHRDKFAVDEKFEVVRSRMSDFTDSQLTDTDLERKYVINQPKGWTLSVQRDKLRKQKDYEHFISRIAYRPFDDQYTILNSAVCDRPRTEILDHILNKDNLCLLASKQQATSGFRHCFISKLPANDCVMSTTSREANQIFPLYLYPDDNAQQTLDGRTERVPNLNSEIVERIAAAVGLTFVAEKAEGSKINLAQDSQEGGFTPALQSSAGSGGKPAFQTASDELEGVTPAGSNDNSFAPIDILDYIYAVLHSPSYREKYKEFLKIDFPRVPYPKDAATFWELVALGGELRQIHLLESPVVSRFITSFNVGGDNIVEKPEYKNGSVYFNDTQYFANVPEIAWNFYIGGYQPAQKWLKDRKGRHLGYDEIQHYQKIIVALTETDRLMKEIDRIDLTD
ncbi:MAG: type ISP restriction/modification enzyme [Pyrinomonadaceae bacterium]